MYTILSANNPLIYFGTSFHFEILHKLFTSPSTWNENEI